MKYDNDDISPSECGDDDADYEILSKCVDPALKKLKQTARRNVNDVIQEEKLKSKLFVQENAAAQTPSKAIINKTNIREASKKANKMNKDELYDKLYSDLSSKEAKNYLKKVWTRKENYK